MSLKSLLAAAALLGTSILASSHSVQAQTTPGKEPEQPKTTEARQPKTVPLPAWVTINEKGEFDEAKAQNMIKALNLSENADTIRAFYEANKDNKNVDYVSLVDKLTNGNKDAVEMAKYVQEELGKDKSANTVNTILAGVLSALFVSGAAVGGYVNFKEKDPLLHATSLAFLTVGLAFGGLTAYGALVEKPQIKAKQQQLVSFEEKDLEKTLLKGYQAASQYYMNSIGKKGQLVNRNNIIMLQVLNQQIVNRNMGMGNF